MSEEQHAIRRKWIDIDKIFDGAARFCRKTNLTPLMAFAFGIFIAILIFLYGLLTSKQSDVLKIIVTGFLLIFVCFFIKIALDAHITIQKDKARRNKWNKRTNKNRLNN